MIELDDNWSYDEDTKICYKNNLRAFKLVADIEPKIDSSFVRDRAPACRKYSLDESSRVYFGDIPLGIVMQCIKIEKASVEDLDDMNDMNGTFDSLVGFGDAIQIPDDSLNSFDGFDEIDDFDKIEGLNFEPEEDK